MIVRDDSDSLLLITQPDHAGLAADLMRAWRGEGLADRATREAALFATRQHDIGWTGFDAAPTVDPASGRPHDFLTAPREVRQGVWRRALEQLPAQSTYAAALIAQHALTVYRRYRGQSAWDPFFAELEEARDRWFTTDVRPDGSTGGATDPPLGSRRAFLQDYAVVGTGDLLSLIFCNQWTTPHLAEGYEIVLNGSELTISPDPFGGQRIRAGVRARRIARRRYASDDDLREALSAATDRVLEVVAAGSDEPPSS